MVAESRPPRAIGSRDESSDFAPLARRKIARAAREPYGRSAAYEPLGPFPAMNCPVNPGHAGHARALWAALALACASMLIALRDRGTATGRRKHPRSGSNACLGRQSPRWAPSPAQRIETPARRRAVVTAWHDLRKPPEAIHRQACPSSASHRLSPEWVPSPALRRETFMRHRGLRGRAPGNRKGAPLGTGDNLDDRGSGGRNGGNRGTLAARLRPDIHSIALSPLGRRGVLGRSAVALSTAPPRATFHDPRPI